MRDPASFDGTFEGRGNVRLHGHVAEALRTILAGECLGHARLREVSGDGSGCQGAKPDGWHDAPSTSANLLRDAGTHKKTRAECRPVAAISARVFQAYRSDVRHLMPLLPAGP